VNVAGSVVDIEDLTGLCDRAEQRIVAPLPFLLTIEANRSALSKAAGGDHRPVEVDSQPPKTDRGHSFRHELPAQLAKSRHTLRIS
jgi:hypothetical protein